MESFPQKRQEYLGLTKRRSKMGFEKAAATARLRLRSQRHLMSVSCDLTSRTAMPAVVLLTYSFKPHAKTGLARLALTLKDEKLAAAIHSGKTTL